MQKNVKTTVAKGMKTVLDTVLKTGEVSNEYMHR